MHPPPHPGQRLRALLDGREIVVMPGVYDALSARLGSAHGFQAVVAGGNAATGTLLGAPDMGQLGMRDYADHYARLAAASDVPLLVDADTGFGGVHNVVRTVRAFERAGAAGLFIEDQSFPKRCGYLEGKSVIPAQDQVAKLVAALDARRDPDFIICARTDALAIEGLEGAIDRAGRYRQAGADMAFVQGADSVETLTKVCRAVPGWHIANISQAGSGRRLTVAECQASGAAAAIFPIAATLAAAAAVERMLIALKRDQGLEAVMPEMMPMGRYNEVVGLSRLEADELRYSAAR